MCIKKLTLEIYTRYYNHTLEMAISRKLARSKRFKEADVCYVLRSLLDVWKHISDEIDGKYVSLFNLNNVYLSPEGYVKMYPFPIDLEFVSSPLRTRKHAIQPTMLLNEEVQVEISPKKSQVSTTPGSPRRIVRQLSSRDNLRDIGTILFQLVLLKKEDEEG
jgi:hypothetical protein